MIAPWWKTGVIYQIYLRSFRDADGDGIGDLKGILDKMAHFDETLGVQAVWITPFFPSPMNDFGYDVRNYTDVDPLFGDLATFEKLVSAAHRRGIKVIIDFICNHTSDQHPWFLDSRSARDNARRNWYVWADPRPDGTPPNNWLSLFGGSAWEWDQKTGQYYLHSFFREQPDLNWRSPEVRAAMLDVLRFWIDRGVDGFRINNVQRLMKDPGLRDNPVSAVQHRPRRSMGPYHMQSHRHDRGHADLHPLLAEMRTVLDTHRPGFPRLAIGEVHARDPEQWATFFGPDNDELHLPLNYSLITTPWNARAVRRAVDRTEAALPDGAWPTYVLGNHDEHRLASRVGAAQARVAAMLLLTLRGTPTIYYGDEIGMTETDVPVQCQQDPWGVRMVGLGRDGCRTPMQWSDKPNGGFSGCEAQQLWLPVNDNHPVCNVSAQLKVSDSMLALYRKLLFMRKNSPALQLGDYRPLDRVPKDCFAFRRVHEEEEFLIALNFGDSEMTVDLAGAISGGKTLISTHPLKEMYRVDDALHLRGNEGLVVKVAR